MSADPFLDPTDRCWACGARIMGPAAGAIPIGGGGYASVCASCVRRTLDDTGRRALVRGAHDKRAQYYADCHAWRARGFLNLDPSRGAL